MRKKLFGDRNFYSRVIGVSFPIMIQFGITNFVGLLDNIMVGRVGTEQMSGIAIVNQLLMIFNISIFGAMSGAGIFGAQFFGKGDHEGMRHTFRFKVCIGLGITVLAMLMLGAWGEALIALFLHGEGKEEALAATLGYGKAYLWVMLAGLLPVSIEQTYSSSLRECGETRLPMQAGVAAVLINLALNYVLIFGNLGFPRLGVVGAAVATVVSRYVQIIIVVLWTHRHKKKAPFIENAYSGLYIPAGLTIDILKKGLPLLVNEILWSGGMATLMQCYSMRGLEVVAGLNISGTIVNVFNVVYMAMGSAISILVGQLLGAGKMEEARDTDTKLIAFAVAVSAATGLVLALAAPLFPVIYKTSPEVKSLATDFIRISALYMPLSAFMHASYFTLRSGGKTIITFLFDSVFLWCLNIPLAYVLSRFTALPIEPLYLICQFVDINKCILGFVLVKKGIWMHNIVAGPEEKTAREH